MAAGKPGGGTGTNLLFSSSATEFSFNVPFIPVSQAPAAPPGPALLPAGTERGRRGGRAAGNAGDVRGPAGPATTGKERWGRGSPQSRAGAPRGAVGLGRAGTCGLDPALGLPEPRVPDGASGETLLGITFSAFRHFISSTSPCLMLLSVVFSAVSKEGRCLSRFQLTDASVLPFSVYLMFSHF